MFNQQTKLSSVENLGSIDRANRMIVALTLVAVVEMFTAIPPVAVFSIVVIGMYAGLTAAIGWDPLYVIVKALSQRAPVQTSATVTALKQQEVETGDTYKKAA